MINIAGVLPDVLLLYNDYQGTISVGLGVTTTVVGRLLTSNEPTVEESIRTEGSNNKSKNKKFPYQLHLPIALHSPATTPEKIVDGGEVNRFSLVAFPLNRANK